MVNIEDPPTAESIVHRKFGVLMTTEAQACAIGIFPNRLSGPACQPIMTSIMQNKPNLVRRRRIANERKVNINKGL